MTPVWRLAWISHCRNDDNFVFVFVLELSIVVTHSMCAILRIDQIDRGREGVTEIQARSKRPTARNRLFDAPNLLIIDEMTNPRDREHNVHARGNGGTRPSARSFTTGTASSML